MAVTLKDVAARAGVSRSAVSRTFTDGASVSARTRRKVMEAADALGYRPSVFASSLTTRRTRLIGLVSDNFRNPIFLEVFDQFTRAIQAVGYRPLLVNLGDTEGATNPVEMLQSYSVDGVLIASSTLPAETVSEFAHSGIPLVHTFGRYTNSPTVDTLAVNNERCGALAARALLDRDYKRIAFLGGPEEATSTQDRMAGFLSEAASASGVSTSVSFASAYSFAAGRAEMQRLIAADDALAEGYFCGDDVLSVGAMSALQEAGIQVPSDVGIIGFNDMAMASWQNINLTTVHQPLEEIIGASVNRLLELLDNKEATPQSRLFEGQVMDRGTLPPLG
ncbi:MAG: LacI family DNA-binding transcriptional regulator [Pseudomonadota bacterium]